MWPASMFAKSRTESEISRMNCEITSSTKMKGIKNFGTPSGIQLFTYLIGPLYRTPSTWVPTNVSNASASATLRLAVAA